MIKFEHSIFALPFALTGALLAWRDAGFPQGLLWAKLGWIVLAMVAARSVAMAFNRVLDADIDAPILAPRRGIFPRDCFRGSSPGASSCSGLPFLPWPPQD